MSYQDQVVKKIITECLAQLARTDLAGPMRSTIDKALCFWTKVQDDRKLSSSLLPVVREYGHYVVVRVTHNNASDEWTNIGVMVYNSKGEQIWAKMGPYDRAKSRGDLKEHHTVEELDAYPKHKQTLDVVKQSLRSDGHYMSDLQMTAPRTMEVHKEVCWSLYQKMVLGMKW